VKRIVILDTWVNDTNVGNRIILEAVEREIRSMFPHDFVYSAPALEYIDAGRELVSVADHVFLAGTNLLSADMNRTSEWRVRLRDTAWVNDVVLMGVGWWQYQDQAPNRYTKRLLGRLLSRDSLHSVRDSYTGARLQALGFAAVSTSCPSTWSLTEDVCAAVPAERSGKALVTFTEYNQDPVADRRLLELLSERYERVVLWPQQYGDVAYARSLDGRGLELIDPQLGALDDFLRSEEVDYVGTRLHAGIRALQNRRRTLIVGVDNRALEMSRDLGLPVVRRDQLELELPRRIDSSWPTVIRLPVEAVTEWKAQFHADDA
jgi:polysaccharide pyruvyl transferase WcaK-like protein